MEFVVPVALVAALGLLCLAMDGVIRVPLHKLANFPFKGLPATNGVLFGLAIFAGLTAMAGLR